jgi:hypothetical protein
VYHLVPALAAVGAHVDGRKWAVLHVLGRKWAAFRWGLA